MKNSKGQTLPQPYFDLAMMRREQQGGKGDDINELSCFDWAKTHENEWWLWVWEGETPKIPDASLAELEAWRKSREENNQEAMVADDPEPDYKAMYEQLLKDFEYCRIEKEKMCAEMSHTKPAQSSDRNWIAECVPFQKCPVCDGYGEVRPIWNKDAQQPTYVKCSVCDGNKVILMYNAEAWAAEGKKRGRL